MRHSGVFLLAKALLVGCLFSALTAAAEGGGLLDAGIMGQYFSNNGLTGAPSFSRRDVRIAFDWGVHAPGGSRSPTYAAVGGDNFSVLWSGRLWARFGEVYRFKATGDDWIRLRLKPTGTSTWTTLVDTVGPSATEATSTLAAGGIYDIEVAYAEYTGGAVAKVEWSSPSTPWEVIEATAPGGINIAANTALAHADAMRAGRDEWENNPPLDAEGWPTSANSSIILWEGVPYPAQRAGDYALSFQGKADVAVNWTTCDIRVAGVSYGQNLASGIGYDAASNTTRAVLRFSNSEICRLDFNNAVRNPGGSPVQSGIRAVRLMVPTTAGAASSVAEGVIWRPQHLKNLEPYTVLRWIMNQEASLATEREWSERKLPSHRSFGNSEDFRQWELMIGMSNESGKDMMVSVPHRASNEYYTKLANLIRYGSDGVNPYLANTANPVWPPLNSNLRVYLERSNEVWNFYGSSFSQAPQSQADALQAVNTGTVDGKIINYDGKADTGGDWLRWNAVRTVRLSEAFRSVWGDSAMGDRVRVVLETQYTYDERAKKQLIFLDRWFNNADGAHVAVPKPVNWYLWGSGGAQYYGSGNPKGFENRVTLTNGGFENGTTGWTLGVGATVGNGQGAGLPAPKHGANVVVLPPTAYAETTFNAPAPGMYAVNYRAAANSDTDYSGNGIRITIAGQNATTSGTPWVYRWSNPDSAWWPSRYGKSFNDYMMETDYGDFPFSSLPIQVSAAGPVTIRFSNTFPSGRTIGIDQVKLTSAEAIRDGGMPGEGEALGQVVSTNGYRYQLNTQALYPAAYGLHYVGYEAGWSVGGDNGGDCLQNWCKYVAPWAADKQRESMDIFNQAGGVMNAQGSYAQWPDMFAEGTSFPLWKGQRDHAALPRPEATNGVDLSVSRTFTPSDRRWDGEMYEGGGSLGAGAISVGGNFMLWMGIAPTRGTWSFTVTGTSGAYFLEVNGVRLNATAAQGITSWSTDLLKGQQSIVIKAAPGGCAVSQVVVEKITTVTPVNRAPVAQNGSFTTAFNTALSVTVQASDDDGNILTYAIVSGSGHGTLSGSGASRTYTPTAGYSGSDSFTFRVNDGQVNSNLATVSITVAAAVVVTPPDRGFSATYFNSFDLSGTGLRRTDAAINFDFGFSSPMPSINADFSVRWQGIITPNFSQTYSFIATTDDGVRLWVDGQLLINQWVAQGATAATGSIALTAGRPVALVMEYYDGGGQGSAKLEWQSANQARQVVPLNAVAPTGLIPAGWTAGDVGAPGAVGSSTVTNGRWVVIGSGSDIWNSADDFHFLSRPVTGDLQITARVVSLTDTDPWAKAGVMLRVNRTVGSKHVFMCQTAKNGLAYQRRPTANSGSVHTAGPVGSWVRLERIGSTCIASASADGVVWTEVRREQVSLPSAVFVGLGVTSHVAGTLTTAVFSDVVIIAAGSVIN